MVAGVCGMMPGAGGCWRLTCVRAWVAPPSAAQVETEVQLQAAAHEVAVMQQRLREAEVRFREEAAAQVGRWLTVAVGPPSTHTPPQRQRQVIYRLNMFVCAHLCGEFGPLLLCDSPRDLPRQSNAIEVGVLCTTHGREHSAASPVLPPPPGHIGDLAARIPMPCPLATLANCAVLCCAMPCRAVLAPCVMCAQRVPPEVLEEALELRSKVAVLGQQLEKRNADVDDVAKQLQARAAMASWGPRPDGGQAPTGALWVWVWQGGKQGWQGW